MDAGRRADARSLVSGHSPLRALDQQSHLPAQARDRGARPALPNGVAESRDGERSQFAQDSIARPPRAARGMFWEQEWLGAAQLVRHARHEAGGGIFLWPPKLV